MTKKKHIAKTPSLSRRENEVMDVLFKRESATAREVWSALGKNRTYSTIRKLLSILEEKGHVAHRKEGAAFVYEPKVARETAGSSALQKLVDTFFQGSVAGAVSSLLGDKGENLSSDELDRIEEMISDARRKETK